MNEQRCMMENVGQRACAAMVAVLALVVGIGQAGAIAQTNTAGGSGGIQPVPKTIKDGLTPVAPVTPPGTVSRPVTAGLPLITVTQDDVVITTSCAIAIPPNRVIADANNNGVIQIGAPNVTIEFYPGSVLRGSAAGAAPDTYAGYGIRINGHEGVTIRNATISGYKAAVYATGANGLTIEESNASDNFRQRLRSTPASEDQSDWLYPHRNDGNEHLTNYGAAFYIEDSKQVTVRKCVVRSGQNGLILDRVDESRVFDNDFSFNSGWGIFLYRSSGNTISRNACDFNIRGYSHGVYNRGQDSAGIALFEQCSKNVIADNSATHCGDGIFVFAGVEALGEDWFRAEQERLRAVTSGAGNGEGGDMSHLVTVPADVVMRHQRLGCNDNVFMKNDLSFSAAHGLELTFSFGNTVVSNLIRHNGICGLWGGYSQETLIGGNNFTSNGLPNTATDGSGEGGGINIEHGAANRLIGNKFVANPVGIKLWSDDDAHLMRLPWAKANHKGSADNVLKMNSFDGDSLAVRFTKTTGTKTSVNRFKGIEFAKQLSSDAESASAEEPLVMADAFQNPNVVLFGETKPFNARPTLHGRENIVMTEWGPWDHERPLTRRGKAPTGADGKGVPAGVAAHEFFGLPSREIRAQVVRGDVGISFVPDRVNPNIMLVTPKGGNGVTAYAVTVTSGDYTTTVSGTIVASNWNVTFFPTPDYGVKAGPPNLEEWRGLAKSAEARTMVAPGIDFRFAGGGPGAVLSNAGGGDWKGGADHFGTIAVTTMALPAGTYRVRTTSDDGVRVIANNTVLIERWDWHTPTMHEGELKMEAAGEVTFVVEHFEIDGHAELRFEIEAVQ